MRKTILLAAAMAICATCIVHEPLEAKVIAYDGTDVQVISIDQVNSEGFITPFKLEAYHLNDVAIEVATPEGALAEVASSLAMTGKMAYLVPVQSPVRNVQSVYALHQWPPKRCSVPALYYNEVACKKYDRGLAYRYKANPLIVPLNSAGIIS